jgi:predicted nucleic acid-binding protein
MRVLVDTSVWVDYLREGNRRLTALLENDQVLCHPFVIGELACGWLESRQEILERLDLLPKAVSVQHPEALEFIDSHGLWGKGIGFIDVHLLASAFLSDARLWTRDKRLLRVTRDLRRII